MKTRTLRNAISIALLAVASGAAGAVGARAATAQVATQPPAAAQKTPAAVAPNAGEPPRPGSPEAAIAATAPAQTAATELESIEVTGTRIKGGAVPSPVISISAAHIQEEDFSDLGEVIRSVPQNFSGGQNPGVLSGNLAGAGNANQNMTGGASLNLRGLGADATLTLLNGRRLAYGGFTQAVDLSAIPVEAVERLEIVADGASAIYGSDAVGGVGNVILKRDYDGVSVGTRFGRATQGGLTSRQYNVTAGTTWRSGGVIATYQDVSADPIYSRQRSYTTQLVDPSTLYPGSDLRSGLLSAYQALGDNAELRLDALRTERDQLHFYAVSGRNSRVTPTTTSLLLSPSLAVWLPNDWTLTLGATDGNSKHDQYRQETALASGAVSVTDLCYCNDSRSYELGAEGPLFALPAGDARLAAGVGYRSNTFRNVNHVNGVETIDGSESARFAYAEVSLPVVDPAQGVPGVQRLTLTAAVRGEDYSSFGGVTTPKFGVLYAPGSDVTLKASWGKSFKAPTLFERNYAQEAWLFQPGAFGGVGFPAGTTVLVADGGNQDLQPERAITRSVSLAWHPEALDGLEAELTWFGVDYSNRVLQPIANASQALRNPIYAPFVDRTPTAQAQADVIALASRFSNFAGVAYDPSRVAAIIYTQYANVAQQDIEGLDLSGSYQVALARGTLTLRGSASWLDSTQQTLPAQPTYDLSGTLFNPPKLSGRVGAVWKQGGLTASLFGNYRGGVRNRADGVESASFTTFDMALRYATGARRDAWAGLEFGASVDNAFDRDPPLYRVTSPLYVAPYDSTNYSAIGRFVSVSVSKHW
ncbi:TonB-dependent receptor [Xanthomonas arboricola]|uniref:TonB-dependent receptor plug domain-containing protein n=1 Tax=Xanthomonas arboricola TaxID=56448 RepID=UPI001608A215|nr:TonB-dependent receptor [Xanthomonas arboricola]MBB3797609.1 outer membrane receptor protein involved in Fe transport [Xanthomonas arboricola]MCC8670958.1 TonB-dependent receptor [Xanthomonas arboricola]